MPSAFFALFSCFGYRISLFPQLAWAMIFLFYDSHCHGKSCAQHCAQLLPPFPLRWVCYFFCSSWSQPPAQLGMTGMSNHDQILFKVESQDSTFCLELWSSKSQPWDYRFEPLAPRLNIYLKKKSGKEEWNFVVCK
jgi:hypothetical protein